jgi:mono/diheme cytochrome c family protein
LTFLRNPDQPADYRGAALVALHGSWNRSELSGYKVVSLHWDADGTIRERDFFTGFQVGDDVIGRPVDVAEGPDGAIYVSDDYAAAIYRITRSDESPAVTTLTSALPKPEAATDPLAGHDEEAREVLVARGAVLFAQQACASCHVEGQAAPGIVVKPLANLAERFTLQSLAGFLLTPQPPMPIVDLSEADRIALAAHLLDQDTRAREASAH